MQTNDDCFQMSEEELQKIIEGYQFSEEELNAANACFLTDDEYSSIYNFYEKLLMNFNLRHDMYEKFGELDFIAFYKFVLKHIEGKEDVRNEDWVVVLELEEMPIIQMYLNGISNEKLDKSEEEVIEEIIRTIEEKNKASKNPFNKIVKYFKA